MLTETTLVVHRKAGQAIQADGPCTFKVLAISGNRVKVACTAESEVRFVRTELLEDDTTIIDDGGPTL